MVTTLRLWARQALLPRLTLAHAAAVLFVMASGAANLRYGLEYGRSPLEKFIAGGASIGADLWLAVSFVFLAAATKSRKFGQALAATILLCVTLLYSVHAGIGFASTARAELTGHRAAVERTDTLTLTEYKLTSEKLAKLDKMPKLTRDQRSERAQLEASRRVALGQLQRADNLAPADPAEQSIATYLGKLGLTIGHGDLLPWQTLMFVVLVVLGGPLCLWLAEARVPARELSTEQRLTDSQQTSVGKFAAKSITRVSNPSVTLTPPKGGGRKRKPKSSVENVIQLTPTARRALGRLGKLGGSVQASSMAEVSRQLKVPRTSLRRVVREWEGAGAVQLFEAPGQVRLMAA